MPQDDPLIFAPDADHDLGRRVADALGCEPAALEFRAFEDGEHKMRPMVDVTGRDVYVVESLRGGGGMSANDRLCRLLFFIGALKDALAARVTAVSPYLAYARKDRRTKSRDPVTTRYVAQLFEAIGLDRVVVMDVHNIAAFENAFRCPKLHLEAAPLFVERIAVEAGDAPLVVVSPDSGGAKRAERLRQLLAQRLDREIAIGFLEKTRSGGVVGGDLVIGPVGEGFAVIVDDLISTGTTILRAARACRSAGARRVFALATHGLFNAEAARALDDAALDRLIVTNAVALPGDLGLGRLEVLDVAPLIAEAIRLLHGGAGAAPDALFV